VDAAVTGGTGGSDAATLSCVGTHCVYPGGLNGICTQGVCSQCTSASQCISWGEMSACSGGSCSTTATLRPCSRPTDSNSGTAQRQFDMSGGVAPQSYFVNFAVDGNLYIGGVLCLPTQERVDSSASCYDLYQCGSCKILLAGTSKWVMGAEETKTETVPSTTLCIG